MALRLDPGNRQAQNLMQLLNASGFGPAYYRDPNGEPFRRRHGLMLSGRPYSGRRLGLPTRARILGTRKFRDSIGPARHRDDRFACTVSPDLRRSHRRRDPHAGSCRTPAPSFGLLSGNYLAKTPAAHKAPEPRGKLD